MATTRRDYVALGAQLIMDLLSREHAMVWPEVEAKLAAHPQVPLPPGVKYISAPHLTSARRWLQEHEHIASDTAATRGGRMIQVIVPTDTRRRKRAIQDASARKRLLEARYLGWASGGHGSGQGVIGPAGEAVVHASLSAAAPYGYRLMNPRNGKVTRVHGVPLLGELDNGAFYTEADEFGTPTGTVFDLLVEVKNIRGFMSPNSSELYQLLAKAAAVQERHESRHLVPVLVCSYSNYNTILMAKRLGFYIIQMKRQYAPVFLASDEHLGYLNEVREELGYRLDTVEGPIKEQVAHFSTIIPTQAPSTAAAWKLTVKHFGANFFNIMRLSSNFDRNELVEELRLRSHRLHGGSW